MVLYNFMAVLVSIWGGASPPPDPLRPSVRPRGGGGLRPPAPRPARPRVAKLVQKPNKNGGVDRLMTGGEGYLSPFT